MPQKPIAYAADYVHAEENYISMRQRQLMDVAHRHHLEHIEAPIKKDIVLNYTKTNSPNKKKQQQVQDRQLVISNENQNLVGRIEKIMGRRNECVHTSSGSGINKPTNLSMRLKTQARLQSENRAIKTHLSSVKGTYSVAQWEKEAEASHRLSQQISKTTKRAKTRTHQRKHQKDLVDKQATADDFEFLVLDDQQNQHLALKTVKSVKEHVQSKLPLIHNKANAYLAQHKLDPFEVPRRPFE
ncbi:hypothetical protein AC1031_014191 [Aphanomyces cochlioides]|nr:hypothetical protein AC1031_014191 [Aphanomyces cochlioides]